MMRNKWLRVTSLQVVQILIASLLAALPISIFTAPAADAAPGAPTITKIEFISVKQAKIFLTPHL